MDGALSPFRQACAAAGVAIELPHENCACSAEHETLHCDPAGQAYCPDCLQDVH